MPENRTRNLLIKRQPLAQEPKRMWWKYVSSIPLLSTKKNLLEPIFFNFATICNGPILSEKFYFLKGIRNRSAQICLSLCIGFIAATAAGMGAELKMESSSVAPAALEFSRPEISAHWGVN